MPTISFTFQILLFTYFHRFRFCAVERCLFFFFFTPRLTATVRSFACVVVRTKSDILYNSISSIASHFIQEWHYFQEQINKKSERERIDLRNVLVDIWKKKKIWKHRCVCVMCMLKCKDWYNFLFESVIIHFIMKIKRMSWIQKKKKITSTDIRINDTRWKFPINGQNNTQHTHRIACKGLLAQACWHLHLKIQYKNENYKFYFYINPSCNCQFYSEVKRQ